VLLVFLQARDVFTKILPEEEFLPKAPNPEDIIYVDDAEAQVADGNSQSEFAEQETDQSEPAKQSDASAESQSETTTQIDKLETFDSNQSEAVKQEERSEAPTGNTAADSQDQKNKCEDEIQSQNNES